MRIIFVGIHNKPGLQPLDSATRSGKLIDRIIEKISDHEILKSNLYDCDYMPPIDRLAANKWAGRVCYDPQQDIVFALGAITQQHFRGSRVKVIPLGHPSGVWSHEKQKEYVERALAKVEQVVNPF